MQTTTISYKVPALETDVVLITHDHSDHNAINASDADEVIRILRPRIVIPMHYKTPAINLPIEPLDKFLTNKLNVRRLDSNELTITSEQLPTETTIVMLRYSKV